MVSQDGKYKKFLDYSSVGEGDYCPEMAEYLVHVFCHVPTSI